MFESQPSFWIQIEMNSTVIIGYGWHHISVISLHEAVELYWHRLNTLGTFAGDTFCSSKSLSNSACKSVSAKRKSTSVVLNISLEFFSLLPTFDIFSVLDGRVVFVNFWPQGFVRVSFKQSEISRFFLSLDLVWMSKSVLSSVCLFICKTKLKTLTKWTVSGPEGGIAITTSGTPRAFPQVKKQARIWMYWYALKC